MLQVGSAGHLLHSNLGAKIDAHDVVLRFNDAPAANTAEEELGRHVGSRTTHRLLHAESSIVASLYTRQGWAKNASKTENLIFRGDWKEDVALFRRLHHLESPPSAGEGESNKARARRGTRDGRAERNLSILSTCSASCGRFTPVTKSTPTASVLYPNPISRSTGMLAVEAVEAVEVVPRMLDGHESFLLLLPRPIHAP